jgi:hypothetical protein
MSAPASPRRATYDAIALAIAFLVADGAAIFAVLAGWVDYDVGFVALLSFAAIILLLYRDDIADGFAVGHQRLGLAVDDELVREVLNQLTREGWTVKHDVSNERGILIGTLVRGESGAYIVHTRNRAYRLEHLRRARRDATWLHSLVGGWVTPVLCLALRDDAPHRRDGVWIMGADHLADWLRARTPPRGRRDRYGVVSDERTHGLKFQETTDVREDDARARGQGEARPQAGETGGAEAARR